MPVHYTALAEINFGQDAYSKDRPVGIWQAAVNQAVYSKGGKTATYQKGRRVGIHLYVEDEISRKIWLFVPLLPGFEPFTVAENLEAGNSIEVKIISSKSGLPVVKTLKKLD